MKSVADAVSQFVATAGPGVVFTLPGSSCLTLLDGMASLGLRIILGREETACVHSAHGDSALNRRFGCVVLSRGPGALNGMCGFATACDGFPVLLLLGDNERVYRGRNVVNQDLPMEAAFAAVGPTYVLVDPVDCADTLLKVHRHLFQERRSCVLIIPSDVQKMDAMGTSLQLPAYTAESAAAGVIDWKMVFQSAERPFILWGRAVSRHPLLNMAAQAVMAAHPGLDYGVTMRGLSNIPPGVRGIVGTQGHPEVNELVVRSDGLLVVGERLAAEATGNLSAFRTSRRITSLAVPGEEQTYIRSDMEEVVSIEQLREALHGLANIRMPSPVGIKERPATDAPPRLSDIFDIMPDTMAVTLDSGQNFFWAAHAIAQGPPRTVLYSDLQGAMGFAIPAAIGATSCRNVPVAAVVGDGGFLMSLAELHTISLERLPVKIIVLDNACLGMVRQTQRTRSLATVGTGLGQTDFVSLAKAFRFRFFDDRSTLSEIKQDLVQPNPSLVLINVDPNRSLRVRGGVNLPLPLQMGNRT